MRKWIAVLLTWAIVLTAMTAMAEAQGSAESDPVCDDYRYRVLDDGTAEILEYVGKKHSLVIPETLDGYTVTSIGDETFYHHPYSLAELTIPENITHIGSMAFALSGLESIEIPKSVISMGNNPFGYCDELERITVAEDNPVFYIQDGVLFCREDHSLVCFPNLQANGQYTVPEGTEKIRGSAFGGVEGLTRIILPDGLKEIGGQAFAFCWDLESIEIPDSVTEIGDAAFDTCKGLKTVVLPAGLTRIGTMMFYECYDLEVADIPETVTEIGESAFDYCTSLKEIRIPAGVTEISDGAFEACEQIRTVVIPTGVTKIGGWAFGGCFHLSEVQIPDGVKEIGDQAFQHCSSLHTLRIPDSVKSIGEDVFIDCAEDLVITGSTGGYVQKYCEQNGIAFHAE